MTSHSTVRRAFVLTLVLSLAPVLAPLASAQAPAAGCAATPADAWTMARQAVATKDAGKVMGVLTPSYRTRNSVEGAVGTSMLIEMGAMSAEMSGKPAEAAKAKATEKQLLGELDALLKKYKVPTIKEIGTPLMQRMEAPEVVARFAPIDHAAFAREIDVLLKKADAAARAGGVSGGDGPPKLDELVVGGGDLNAPLKDLKVAGADATATSGSATMRFKKIDGCWLIDAHK